MSSLHYLLIGYFDEVQDPRTKHLFGLNVTLVHMLCFSFGFNAWAKIIAPKLMKSSNPFQMQNLMLCYNVLMVIFNSISFFWALYLSDFGLKLLDFEYPDRNDHSEKVIQTIHVGYAYLLTKFCDLLDTNFFIARKKWNHISFLHLYHHTSVPLFGWLILKINPTIPGVFLFAIINSFVHVVMYSYYALSALGAQIQKWLWWKKYITLLQLGQFAVYGCYAILLFFFQKGYPQFWLYLACVQPPFFFWMFYEFYRDSYQSKRRKHE